jgi:hypothetical protein
MIRRSGIDVGLVLPPADVGYVVHRVDPEGWYPMDTFERLGLVILSQVEGASLDAVRLWGSFSANEFARAHPELIAPGDPAESLMRLRVLRATLFDFPAFEIDLLEHVQARIAMRYHMGRTAEEAACIQTMGFCEGVLALAGARAIQASWLQCSWLGTERTLIGLKWCSP